MRSCDSNEGIAPLRRDHDRGAVLVLALIFVVAVGLVATALATWATNDLNNSKTFTTVEALHSDASGMMKMSVQYVRYNPIISFNQAAGVSSPVVACWGGTKPANLPLIDHFQVAVWCSTVWNPGSAATRTVTFYACPVAVPASICTLPNKALLTEVVVFDDYPAGQNAATQALCTLTCGSGMTVMSSTWGPSVYDVQAVTPTSISFVQEPSPTSVGVATTAYVQVTGGSSLPISYQTVTLSAASGGTLSSASTLSAVTNTSGVAVFNNIVPSSAGSLVVSAVDGSLTATSTAFQVGKGANSVTPSPAPTNPHIGSQVTVSATATSGDQIVTSGTPGIVVSSSTTSVCTVSGATVALVGVGPCTLSFVDSGNANYRSASATMTFGVVATSPSKIVVTAAASSVSASSAANDTLTLTLETASGAPTVSMGTTTVSLSQDGSGFFADKNGVPLTTVSFQNSSTVSVYFGDQVAQRVTVTASSGSLTSGTTTVTVTAGSPSSVTVTAASPSVSADGVSNDAVTLKLLDQYGNVVTPTADTTLALSSTGGGYFTSAMGGTSHTPSATILANASSATVYFGDTRAEKSQLSATLGGASGTAFVVVTAAAPSQVVVATPNPSATTSSKSSNLTVNVSLDDQYGNPVTPTVDTSLSVSSSGHGFFSSTLGGSTPTACVTIPANVASASVYFGDATSETVVITVGGSVSGSCGTAGLTAATATIQVTAASITGIIITPLTNTIPVSNAGSDATILELVDQNGNPVAATSNVTLALTSSSGTAHFTYVNGGTGYITSRQIPTGSSQVTVYLRDETAQTVTLRANWTTSSGQTVSGSTLVTFTAGAFSKIALTPSPLSLRSSNITSTQIDVQAEDKYGNPVSVGPTSTYHITDISQGSYGNGCFSSQSNVNVVAANGDYCNFYSNDSNNYSYWWPIDLSGGQATVFFGDNQSGDNPQIDIFDANGNWVVGIGSKVR